MPTCPRCRRFVGKLTGYYDGEKFTRVTAICKKHGEVEPDDWDTVPTEKPEPKLVKRHDRQSQEAALRHKAMMLNLCGSLALQVTVQRQRAGLTQRSLAQKAGVRTHEVQQIEEGRFRGALAVLVKIAAVLDIAMIAQFASWPGIKPGVDQ